MATQTKQRIYTPDDERLLEQYQLKRARDNFWCYRQAINKGKMLVGWWQRLVAAELQLFYDDWVAGLRPKLVLQSPPQHGKSKQIVDFISWVSGKKPEAATIYASYSDRLSTRANLNLQRIIEGPVYRRIFPETMLAEPGAARYGLRYLRNLEVLEFVGQPGSFRNTTVLGGVTGEGLNLGVVDDPIKGRAEASSEPIRNKTWGWFTDDFFTRFSDDAALLMILTRWHVDDPVGRLKQEFPEVKLLRYPALAEETDAYRVKGEPLFPELKSLSFLMERKRLLTQAGWESIYQQNPIIVGGGFFPIDKLQFVAKQPAPNQVIGSIRYWDKAGTEDGGAYSAGVLIEETKDHNFVVSDVQRGQWGAMEREKRILQTAIIDNRDRRVKIWVEREPGSGGKESAENTIRNLRGFVADWDLVTGPKETRAEPFAAQVQAGNVSLVASEVWNRDYMNELELFPNGKYKDQVDASGGGFNKLVGRAGPALTGFVKGLY